MPGLGVVLAPWAVHHRGSSSFKGSQGSSVVGLFGLTLAGTGGHVP
jgi:hypothetical protein